MLVDLAVTVRPSALRRQIPCPLSSIVLFRLPAAVRASTIVAGEGKIHQAGEPLLATSRPRENLGRDCAACRSGPWDGAAVPRRTSSSTGLSPPVSVSPGSCTKPWTRRSPKAWATSDARLSALAAGHEPGHRRRGATPTAWGRGGRWLSVGGCGSRPGCRRPPRCRPRSGPR